MITLLPRRPRIDANKKLCIAVLLIAPLVTSCQQAGWAKDEQLANMKPPAGQLPALPESYFPPPPEETSEAAAAPVVAPAPVAAPAPVVQTPQPVVTITQVVPTPVPEPAPRNPEIRIPLPGRLYN